jgi:protocatechuate 3,4-dioxygenase beta subunit
MLGPFYEPSAPLRDSIGEGYVLSGVVRSSAGCSPISNAQMEIWMAGPDGQYSDEYRATLFTDENGAYRFESHFPPPYSGRPSHHHLRVSASGFETLVTQHYPQYGQSEATFDVVLVANP